MWMQGSRGVIDEMDKTSSWMRKQKRDAIQTRMEGYRAECRKKEKAGFSLRIDDRYDMDRFVPRAYKKSGVYKKSNMTLEALKARSKKGKETMGSAGRSAAAAKAWETKRLAKLGIFPAEKVPMTPAQRSDNAKAGWLKRKERVV